MIFLLMEWFLRNPFHERWGIRLPLMAVNLIFFYCVLIFIYALSGSLRLSLYILSAFAFFTGLAEHYVYKFRGSTLLPWDFMSLRTAASVADNYDYTPEGRVVVIILLFILLWVSFLFCDLSIAEKTRLRIILILCSAIFFFLAYVPFVQSEDTIKGLKIYNKLFTPATMTMKDGTVYAFIYDMKFLTVSKPSNYKKNEIRSSLKEEYGGRYVKKSETGRDTPNIIVIMCEAFSDPKVTGEFSTNEDFMPFIRSLMKAENVTSGYLHVSIKGGNTPNTEFEYLTGNTLAFLPNGSIPFQQFIKKRTDALPLYLGRRGYRTVAMHPYKATGWCRDEAYPLLGFDEMYFIDYFEERDPEYIRKYVSDESLFREIINLYKENGTETPLFSFNVTMQNHSEYSGDTEDYPREIKVRGLSGDTAVENYLSLERITDSAFKSLISYFESISDPTVIVFFGDHQAADHVVEPLWRLNGRNGTSLTDEENRLRYKVPFLIWSNFDCSVEHDLEISANFLGNLTLKTAGIDISGYRAFLEEQYEKTPIVSAIHTVDNEGNDRDSELDDPELQKYRRYQYYELFDDYDLFD
ncbi:MAG: LTA synthase family protein [Lachnospiraceae bacterium]|nr:LTA synthase family protein [Lachnospiraceae bacterium]